VARNRLTPAEARRAFRILRACVTTTEFFIRPSAGRIRELWCAAQFATGFEQHIGECWIRFEEDQDYDFLLEVAGDQHPFQVTEVQQPGRKRGDEYRAVENGAPTLGLEDWEPGTALGNTWIRAGIEKKLDRYGEVSQLHLLVYANFFAYERRFEDLAAACAEVAARFASCWVITGDAICSLKVDPSIGGIPAGFWGRIEEW